MTLLLLALLFSPPVAVVGPDPGFSDAVARSVRATWPAPVLPAPDRDALVFRVEERPGGVLELDLSAPGRGHVRRTIALQDTSRFDRAEVAALALPDLLRELPAKPVPAPSPIPPEPAPEAPAVAISTPLPVDAWNEIQRPAPPPPRDGKRPGASRASLSAMPGVFGSAGVAATGGELSIEAAVSELSMFRVSGGAYASPLSGGELRDVRYFPVDATAGGRWSRGRSSFALALGVEALLLSLPGPDLATGVVVQADVRRSLARNLQWGARVSACATSDVIEFEGSSGRQARLPAAFVRGGVHISAGF